MPKKAIKFFSFREGIRFKILLLVLVLVNVFFGYNYLRKNIGYKPVQPVSFSHKLHIEKYGLKCTFCHFSVNSLAYANVPTTKMCIVCHTAVRSDTKLMKPVNISFDDSIAIKWSKIYRLPDYTKFNHSRHIRVMIDCSSCHGEVEKMDSVYQVRALNMKWCLDCHRNPEKFIIPARSISGIYTANYSIPADYKVLNAPSNGKDPYFEAGLDLNILMPLLPVRPPENCMSCHY